VSRDHGPSGAGLQAALVTAIRDPDPGTFEGTRIAIYRSLVRARFREVLRAALPLTSARLGKARLERELDTFLLEGSVASPYLSDLPRSFAASVTWRWRADPGTPSWVCELIEYELALFEVPSAEDDPPSNWGQTSPNSRVRFQRAARIHRFTHAVHRLSSEADPIEPTRQWSAILVYRGADDAAHVLELSALAESLLRRLMRGERLGAAAEAACRETGVECAQGGLAAVAGLLDDLEQREVVTGVSDVD
jgi:hypothetical protein